MNHKLLRQARIVILGMIVMASVCACGSDKELTNYEKGIEALEQQNFETALNSFKSAESDNKSMQLIYRGEGMAYLGLGEYDKSLEAFKSALDMSNGLVKKIDYDINYYMAIAECKSGRLEDAVNTYTAIIDVDKNSCDAYFLRGKVYLDLDNIDLAKSDFDQAILIKKDDPNLYINIYKALMDHGLENDAKAYINTGMASVSKPTAYELGELNYYLGDYTQARNYFEESPETKKTEEGIVFLGKTYVALNDATYAIALFEEYTNNNKTADIVYNELGMLKASNKDYEGALAAFEEGLKNDNPKCKQALMYNKIVANEFLGNFSAANSQMEEYIKLYPDDKTAIREHIFLSSR